MKNDIKIAFVTPYLSTGGAERAFLNIAGYFFKAGLNVQLVAATVVGNHSSSLPAGLQVFDFKNSSPLDSPSFYRNTKALLKYLKAETPDVVICTSDYLNIALIFARFLSSKKCKIIVSQQIHVGSYLKELPFLNRKFIGFIQSIIARKADLVVGASNGVANDYATRYGISTTSNKVCTIYNPIYEEKIVQQAAAKIDDQNFIDADVKLITVGRLVRQKDHATLLKAFKLLQEKVPSAHLYIVGVGGEQQHLEQLARESGISEKLHFLGYKENPYSYVAKCDLFVLSSEYEGFGNVVVEALATGVNVVATDCPSGPAEILNNGAFGFLCPVGDPQALCNAIVTALNNKKPAEQLHKRATEFSIETISKKYMEAVLSILK